MRARFANIPEECASFWRVSAARLRLFFALGSPLHIGVVLVNDMYRYWRPEFGMIRYHLPPQIRIEVDIDVGISASDHHELSNAFPVDHIGLAYIWRFLRVLIAGQPSEAQTPFLISRTPNDKSPLANFDLTFALLP